MRPSAEAYHQDWRKTCAHRWLVRGSILDAPASDCLCSLRISTRAKNALSKAGVVTASGLRDRIARGATNGMLSLRAMRGLGNTTIRTIERALEIERKCEAGAVEVASVGANVSRLTSAIRAFTVDGPEPNGPAEQAMLELGKACERRDWHGVNTHAAVYCDAMADLTRELRIAAEEYFGGDFRKPVGP